jgi:preprotein translocase subunit SecE
VTDFRRDALSIPLGRRAGFRPNRTGAVVGPARIHAMAKPNPVEFMQQVRQEANKVTWPTRKEVGISSLMVVIFMVVSAIFFFIADSIIRWGVQTLLSFGS